MKKILLMFTILLSGIVSAQTFDFTCEVEEEMEMEMEVGQTGPEMFIENFGSRLDSYYTLTADGNSLTITPPADRTQLVVIMTWNEDVLGNETVTFVSSLPYELATGSLGAHEINYSQQFDGNNIQTLAYLSGSLERSGEGYDYFWQVIFNADEDTLNNILSVLFKA